MDIKDFTDQLKLDGYAIVEREVTPNRSLNEHDHDWAVIAMVTAGDFYVHTSNLEKTLNKLGRQQVETLCPWGKQEKFYKINGPC